MNHAHVHRPAPRRHLPARLLLTTALLGALGAAQAAKPPKTRKVDASPQQPAAPDKATLLAEGAAAYNRGDFPGALARWEEAERLYPGLDTRYYLARALKRQNKPERALALLEQALADPRDFAERAQATALLPELRAKVREAQGDAALKAAGEGGPAVVDQAKAAVKAFQEAHRDTPTLALLAKLAQAQRMAGLLTDSVASYERVLGAQPPTSTERLDDTLRAALTRELAGLRSLEAIARGEAALRTAKGATPQPHLLAAGQAFAEACGTSGDPALLLRAADAYLDAGALEQAAQVLDRHDQRRPQGAAAQRARLSALRGQQQLSQGQTQGVRESLEGALRDPSLLPAPLRVQSQLDLALVLRRSGQPTPALERYTQAAAQGAPPALLLHGLQDQQDLRELVTARERLRHPPVYQRPWFIAVMTVTALAVGAGVTAAILTNLPKSEQGDLVVSP